jgi:methionyl aminopeptidase
MSYTYKNIEDMQIAIYDSVSFAKLKKAGQLAKQTLLYMGSLVKEGITTNEIDKLGHEYMLKHNAKPATLGYKGYPKSCCISLNNEICHGIPSDKKLINGDILNIDVTVILDGYYGDTSAMFSVGNISPKARHLIDITKQCLDEAIMLLKPGCTLGDIGAVIQKIAHKNHFSVVEDFCGHGIGHVFHQDPQVLHYGKAGSGLVLEEGMVFTIEPMINAGKKDVRILKDGWTAVTKDFSLSAQFEHMVGITKDGAIIFTE